MEDSVDEPSISTIGLLDSIADFIIYMPIRRNVAAQVFESVHFLQLAAIDVQLTMELL